MNEKPKWLRQGVLVFYAPTRVVFVPEKCYKDNGTAYLTDCVGDKYKLSDCSELRPEHLKGVTLMITGATPITIYPNSRGLVVSDGCRKLLVIPNAIEDDQAKAAAHNLAQMFRGEVYSEVIA